MAFIRQDPSILGKEEDRERQQVQDNDLFVDSLVEVKECYKFGSRDKIINVKEKLRDNVSFYKSIVAPDFVFYVIRNGYRLPFINSPESVILPNNRSARDHSSFVDEAFAGVVLKVQAVLSRLLMHLLLSILYLYQFSLAGRRG